MLQRYMKQSLSLNLGVMKFQRDGGWGEHMFKVHV